MVYRFNDLPSELKQAFLNEYGQVEYNKASKENRMIVSDGSSASGIKESTLYRKAEEQGLIAKTQVSSLSGEALIVARGQYPNKSSLSREELQYVQEQVRQSKTYKYIPITSGNVTAQEEAIYYGTKETSQDIRAKETQAKQEQQAQQEVVMLQQQTDIKARDGLTPTEVTKLQEIASTTKYIDKEAYTNSLLNAFGEQQAVSNITTLENRKAEEDYLKAFGQAQAESNIATLQGRRDILDQARESSIMQPSQEGNTFNLSNIPMTVTRGDKTPVMETSQSFASMPYLRGEVQATTKTEGYETISLMGRDINLNKAKDSFSSFKGWTQREITVPLQKKGILPSGLAVGLEAGATYGGLFAFGTGKYTLETIKTPYKPVVDVAKFGKELVLNPPETILGALTVWKNPEAFGETFASGVILGGYGKGLKVTSSYILPKKVPSNIPEPFRKEYKAYMKASSKLDKSRDIKDINFNRAESVPKKAVPILEKAFKNNPDITVGGTLALETSGVKLLRLPKDVDTYYKDIKSRVKITNEITSGLKNVGIEAKVGVVKKVKGVEKFVETKAGKGDIFIEGKESITFHPYEKLTSTLGTVKSPLLPTEVYLYKTKKGVSVVDPSLISKRKFLGGFEKGSKSDYADLIKKVGLKQAQAETFKGKFYRYSKDIPSAIQSSELILKKQLSKAKESALYPVRIAKEFRTGKGLEYLEPYKKKAKVERATAEPNYYKGKEPSLFSTKYVDFKPDTTMFKNKKGIRLYHGTDVVSAEKILKEGLSSARSRNAKGKIVTNIVTGEKSIFPQEPYVSTAKQKWVAKAYAGDKGVVLKIDIPNKLYKEYKRKLIAFPDPFSWGEKNISFSKTIKPEFITKDIEGFKRKKITAIKKSNYIKPYKVIKTKTSYPSFAPVATSPYKVTTVPKYKPVATPPYKPVATPPYKPVATPPYKPVATPPYKPIATPTYKPVATPPYKPIPTPPYKPTITPPYIPPPYKPSITPPYIPPPYKPNGEIPPPPNKPKVIIRPMSNRQPNNPSYQAFIKTNEGYKAASQPMPKNKALNTAFNIVDNTTAKSFILRRVGQTTTKDEQLNSKFAEKLRRVKGRSKLNVYSYVEKDKYAIDSIGEKIGLKYRG